MLTCVPRYARSGIHGLSRKFRIMDDDGSKSLDLSEFKKAMTEMNMGLSSKAIQNLFAYFDADGSGSVEFEEFIQGVRDPLNDRRLKVVKQAFKIIDVDGSWTVVLTHLHAVIIHATNSLIYSREWVGGT